jgi:hypothetical protein
MSPLEEISEWFDEQDAEVQGDIAFLVSMLLFDDLSFEDHEKPRPKLSAWLDAKGLPRYLDVGRAIRFRACFEFAYAKRFEPAGWAHTEEMFRAIVTTGANDPDSMEAKFSGSAFPMLRALPERIEVWRAVGISWRRLWSERLTSERLEAWTVSASE